MTVGILNPQDDTRATATRPDHVDTGAAARKWFSDTLKTRLKRLDMNGILAQFRTAGDAAGVADAEGDDAYLLKIIQALTPERLTGNRTYYIRTDGSDGNDGLANSAGGAFLTIQKAFAVVSDVDLAGYTATIQVADGTYAAGFSQTVPFRNGNVILRGNPTTPANCTVSASGDCFNVENCLIEILGFKLSTSGGNGISGRNCIIKMSGGMDYGSVTAAHLLGNYGTLFQLTANYTISGSAQRHINLSGSRAVYSASITVTLTGTPAFSQEFVSCSQNSLLQLFLGLTVYSGAATGPRYNIDGTSNILTASGTDLDVELPGSLPGNISYSFDGVRALRNLLCNGSGRLQLGPSGTVVDDAYGLHNRWYALTQTGAITPSTITDVQDGLPQMMRLTNTLGSAQRVGYAQIVEGINCKHLRGKQVTISGTLRSTSGGALRFAILEWTGTEDAVTSDVVNNWASGVFTAGNFFNSTTLTVAGSSSITPGANTIGTFALTATLSSNLKNLIVMVWSESTLGASTGTLDMTVQIEEGSYGTKLERRPIGLERDICARYYQAKTVQSQNGSRHIPLLPMRAAPTVAVGVGSAASVTADGFELSHSAAATCTVTATAEL